MSAPATMAYKLSKNFIWIKFGKVGCTFAKWHLDIPDGRCLRQYAVCIYQHIITRMPYKDSILRTHGYRIQSIMTEDLRRLFVIRKTCTVNEVYRIAYAMVLFTLDVYFLYHRQAIYILIVLLFIYSQRTAITVMVIMLEYNITRIPLSCFISS